MAFETLAESAITTQDQLLKGIIEQIMHTTPLLAKLPFVEVTGNALAYNREKADGMPTVEWRSPGDLWTESSASYDNVTAALKILGGDADVDNFIAATQGNFVNQMAQQVKEKSKVMGYAFEDEAYYGDASLGSGFDGLHVLAAADTDQCLHAGSSSTGGPLTTALLDQALDLCTKGQPDMILMTQAVRRRLTQYLRLHGSYVSERDEYGRLWDRWGDNIPIVTSTRLSQVETISDGAYAAKTGGATSSVFVIHFGDQAGLTGIQHGGIAYETFERLQDKNAARTRLLWYCGMALYSTKAVVRIDGVTDAAVAA